MSNTSKGGSKLASELVKQMLRANKAGSSIVAERGEVMSGGKLKMYSIPNAILDQDDYSVCATVYDTEPLKAGDRVLIIHTIDGEPVVVDRIVEAHKV